MSDIITLEKRTHMLELMLAEYQNQIADLKRAGPTKAKAAKKEAEAQTDPYKYRLSSRSLRRLEGVHPDLVKVVKRAIQLTELDFGITEGVRSAERQAKLRADGKSWVKVSKHQIKKDGYGHAIDFAVFIGKSVSWEWEHYVTVSKAFKQASKELNVPITWGGDWERLRDGPHVELKGY